MLFISLFASLSFGMLAVKSCLRKDSKLISESETTIGSTFEIFNWEKDPEPKKLRMDMATMINRNDEDQQMKLLQFIKDRFEQMELRLDKILSHFWPDCISHFKCTNNWSFYVRLFFGYYVWTVRLYVVDQSRCEFMWSVQSFISEFLSSLCCPLFSLILHFNMHIPNSCFLDIIWSKYFWKFWISSKIFVDVLSLVQQKWNVDEKTAARRV